MCFGGGGGRAQQEEVNKQAAEQRVEADIAKREEAEKRARQKREDISDALEASVQRKGGMRVGRGRRSLFRAGGAGFLGRFDR